jgi:hypothetical protein
MDVRLSTPRLFRRLPFSRQANADRSLLFGMLFQGIWEHLQLKR